MYKRDDGKTLFFVFSIVNSSYTVLARRGNYDELSIPDMYRSNCHSMRLCTVSLGEATQTLFIFIAITIHSFNIYLWFYFLLFAFVLIFIAQLASKEPIRPSHKHGGC